jgi:hypothetical protein
MYTYAYTCIEVHETYLQCNIQACYAFFLYWTRFTLKIDQERMQEVTYDQL